LFEVADGMIAWLKDKMKQVMQKKFDGALKFCKLRYQKN
jgi:hypothetical protein